ncbi:UDP-glycosyltransferase UGT5-like [Culicoides brevitarsis]|uniref:UDP-glycosyltransferase UGT5-like n=1 Tax=Culicoides brevitarsis TaxID=469753 RepID=UPI00307C0C4D
MFHVTCKSQWVFGEPLFASLAKKGHHVTVVSPYSSGKVIETYNEVVIPVDFSEHSKITDSFAKGHGFSKNPIAFIGRFIGMILETTNATINHPTFQKIMKEENFDAVIHGFTMNNFQLGLSAHFKCPSIVLSSVPMNGAFSEMVGQPLHPEAVPSIFLASKFRGTMNFWQRLVNLLVVGAERLIGVFQNYLNSKYYESNFPREKYPAFDEVRKNVSLFLANDHFSQGTVKPNLPNVIDVSGLQMSSEPAPLPSDIKTWIDEAKNGLIFVSFGTNVKSKDLRTEKRQILINNFAKLKERVLWKFEDPSLLPHLPPNVMIKKWLPQNDILAHPNTKLFVSHMGIGGFNEAMYHAVPVVALPFGGDQGFNAEKARKQRWAEVVTQAELNDSTFKNALEKVLNDKKYKEAVQKLSNLYRDKPMTAVDTAIYWIEYVIRHRGARHMHYPGAELNFIQSNSIDVYAFILLIVYCCIKIIGFGCRKIKNCCCSKNVIGAENIQKSKKQRKRKTH